MTKFLHITYLPLMKPIVSFVRLRSDDGCQSPLIDLAVDVVSLHCVHLMVVDLRRKQQLTSGGERSHVST